MSHPEQLRFFSAVASANQQLIADSRAIEVGSYDVNGEVRRLFAGAREYVGVDLCEGPGVDIVAFGHELSYPDGTFDLAISGECFEHDPNWKATFENMVRMTRSGGLVAFTCASRGRPEHGTRRSDAALSPGTQSKGMDYYRNLNERDFRLTMPLTSWFSGFQFWYIPWAFDLYFVGVRAGVSPPGPVANLPVGSQVDSLRQLMPWPHKVARAPLAAASWALSEDTYQRVMLPYWSALIRVQDRFLGGRFRRTQPN